MRQLLLPCLLLTLLYSCASGDGTGLNPNLMSDEEITAYNKTQESIWDHIVCIRETHVRSRIARRDCATLTQVRRRMRAGEQLDIISFGTPGIWQ